MPARPAVGAVLSSRVINGFSGSGVPEAQAFPSTTQPAPDLRTVMRSVVHTPGVHVKGTLSFVSSPLKNSRAFFAGLTCKRYPPTPFRLTPKVGNLRPVFVPKNRALALTSSFTLG